MKVYPPRFIITVDGNRAMESAKLRVEFKGTDRELSSEDILHPTKVNNIIVCILVPCLYA